MRTRSLLSAEALFLRSNADREEMGSRATAATLDEAMLRHPDRQFATESERELPIVVDPVRARFSSWYELFPRSTSAIPGQHGTFADCERRLPYIAELGFDVLYTPPIHPIGFKFRKGKNNTVIAEPDDTGSPWAIGAPDGGHKAILKDLGTLDDFRRFVKRAEGFGIQVALDIAFQVSPDHPYVRNTRSGSRSARTEPFSTRRTRPRNIRTFIRSSSKRRSGGSCGRS